jgi:malonate transporter MadL subunit
MTICGTALLATCLLVGMLLGGWLGSLTGLNRDLGGIGLSMLLLIASTEWLRRRNLLPSASEAGIRWWSGMYIPIVVAMACIQDVAGAVSGGPAAFLAAALAVLSGFVCTALFCRAGNRAANGTGA